MGLEVVYEIARYAVDTNAEVLVERAQVLAENGPLRQRDLDGAETPCDEKDVSAVIAAYPSLNEIRANQVTRIEAQPSAFELLPFLLRAPGSADDLDESLDLTRCDRSTLNPAKVTNEAGTASHTSTVFDGAHTTPTRAYGCSPRTTPTWPGRSDRC